jgi:hypothetical protein
VDKKDQRRFYTDSLFYIATLLLLIGLIMLGDIQPRSTAVSTPIFVGASVPICYANCTNTAALGSC